MAKTREERRRRERMKDTIYAVIVLFGTFAVAGWLPNFFDTILK